MPKKSKTQQTIDALQEVIISTALRVLNDPTSSVYSLTRANNTLSGIAKRAQKAEDARRAKDRAKRAARDKASADEAKQEMLANWLPPNGRGPVTPTTRRPVNPDMLPRPGESPAMTRARLEALAAAEAN